MYKICRFDDFLHQQGIEVILQDFFNKHDIEIIKIHFFNEFKCILIYKEKGE